MKVLAFTSRLVLFQFQNATSETTPSKREESKSIVWKFFREGETEKELICQFCPNRKVMRKKQGGSTSNLLRHVKSFHLNDLKTMLEKCKQPRISPALAGLEATNDVNYEDYEDEIRLISEPLD